jgi:methylglyoxal synthase
MNLQKQRIALVAHDNLKPTLVKWAKENRHILADCELFATGTTGKLVTEHTGLLVSCFLSGPYGGDQQIGARISEGLIDILIFFWDPMTPVPHDADVKALLRLATLKNIPIANNQSTADCVLALVQQQVSPSVRHRVLPKGMHNFVPRHPISLAH